MNAQLTVRSAASILLLAVFMAVVAWLYWPGIDGPSMLDDRSSVLVLSALDENPQYAMDYIFGDKAGPLGRPVSMLSFVLEKLYLNEGIRGGKKVNIGLHLINGCLVIWLFNLLLGHIGTPAHRGLALLFGTIWLVSPLYVSTVLYVVQRMAMLATFFMLAACISYCYWRLGVLRGRHRFFLLPLTLVLVLGAIFSKENAIVIVPVLLLMESLWFQFLGPDGQILKWLRALTLGFITAGTAFIVLFFTLGHNWLIDAYRLSYFTPGQRLLTQSRILWDYVAQLLLPDVTRMGLHHDDIVVSESLMQPPVTFYAVLAWLAVLVLLGVLLKWVRGRYLVFAIAVFLIGHSTESTILPLEMYYEHRNYFPGIGLFLGIAVLLGYLLQRWPEIKAPLLAWGGIFVLLLAMRTSSQVLIWSNTSLFHLNNVNAHPASFRVNSNMASMLAGAGALPTALEYSARAHRANTHETVGDYDVRDARLSCLAGQPLPPERIAALGSVDIERPLKSVVTLNALVRQLQNNECPNFDRLMFADRMAVIYLDNAAQGGELSPKLVAQKASPNIYATLAVLENALTRYNNAYRYTELFLMGSPGNPRGLLMKLHFSTALQKDDEVSSVMAQLSALQDAGMLTQADLQTLSLYKEN